ncbi:hypothetical protein [Epilithonimonas hispanica]|uniref:Signal peptidase n=1 Tax=Epilithonimonas hispanica TaxID=358687 RepID=A0A3D9D5I9_9FLAO|nr:hypothetical protein [Epilithonimonas hispanica]REC73244.1 hypothetical protein DRF58_00375 [Epilithonimonas hispanica]
MRKYLSLLFIAISFVSFAQFQENVFEQDKLATSQHRSGADVQGDTGQSSSGTPSSDDADGGLGNPGDEPVPIDGLLPFLFLTGLVFIIYYRGKHKKINI